VIEIDAPIEARTTGAAALEDVQTKLWNLLRDEAVAADMELTNG
jgi:NitT/TauT family transport system ATP-binding protein